GEIASARVENLALPRKLLESAPVLLHRNSSIDMVDLVEIDVVALETTQRVRRVPADLERGKPALLVRRGVRVDHPPVHLRGEHHRVPAAPSLREPSAD